MRLGVIADIHGNLPALEATLTTLQEEHDVDAIVCLGDIVGILGWPHECVQRVRDACTATVIGNHDRGVLPPTDPTAALTEGVTELEYGFVTDRLHSEAVEWLWTRPETVLFPDGRPRDQQALLVHSHPNSAIRWTGNDTVTTEQFEEMGVYCEGGTVLLGHLHEQHAVKLNESADQSGLVLNPGSVGQPYEGPAEFTVVDTVTHDYEFHRVPIPTDRVVDRLRDLGLDTHL